MHGSPYATLTWTSILSISYLLVMITAPWLGAYADSSGNHKLILYVATFFCCVPTMGLGFCNAEMFLTIVILLVVSNFSYSVHQDITASYLVNFCEAKQLGKISGFGWSWGFIGGITTLILCLLWILNAANFLDNTIITTKTKVTGAMLITGGIFGAVSFLALVKLKKFQFSNSKKDWKGAWSRIIKDFKRGENSKDLYDFLFCIFVYQSGIATVITIAAIYAKEVMDFSIDQTIVMILIVNFSACIGAFGFGWLQDKVGHKRSLLVSLITWLFTTILFFLADSHIVFWFAANFAGLAMGASQSGARAAIAYMSPLNKQAENFGLWGFSINAASAVGPCAYGLTTVLTNNNHRLAIIIVGVFFLLGIFLLMRCKFRTPSEIKNCSK